ncbi:MAG: ABC transporter ATP-binding protein [Thermodesulfobacteriota bacterium]
MSYIQVNHLSKHYGGNGTLVKAVQDMTFEIAKGEFVVIMGPSGSGKSTLLSMMGALNAPSTGRYSVDGIDVYSLGTDQRADFRREYLGFVFQSFHLIPYLTVLENAMLPLTTVKGKVQIKRDMAAHALERVGMRDKARRLPGEISGGEQERVAIARAIANEPPVLLADEPTGNLDTRTSRGIMNMFQRLNTDGTTIVMVTHNSACAGYAGRLLRVSDGLLEEPKI